MDLYKKKYGMYGYTEYSAAIPAGNTYLRVNFTNGSMTVRGITPATFVTSDEVVQALIEASDMYKKGKIKLVNSIKVGERSSSSQTQQTEKITSSVETKSASETKVTNTYSNVVNSQQAKEILRSAPYNVSLSELGSKADIQNKAKELGVLFPNWN